LSAEARKSCPWRRVKGNGRCVVQRRKRWRMKYEGRMQERALKWREI